MASALVIVVMNAIMVVVGTRPWRDGSVDKDSKGDDRLGLHTARRVSFVALISVHCLESVGQEDRPRRVRTHGNPSHTSSCELLM